MGASKYEPEKTTITKFFKTGELFEIPRYQRSFAWRDQQVEEFYSDFIKVRKDNLDFLGTIVVDASGSDSVYEIIDGQQRIVAITIIAAAIRDILNHEIDTNDARALATTINNQYILKDALTASDTFYKLKPSLDLEDFFADYIQTDNLKIKEEAKRNVSTRSKKDTSKRNVINAYELIKNRLLSDKVKNQSTKNAIELLKMVILQFNEISFIVIKVFNNDMAYSIFESHNAKGADLAVSDLIKNYFFGKLGGTNATKEKFMRGWDDVVNQIQESANSSIDRFLHYYLQSYEGKFPRSQLYRKIKSVIDKDPQKFIKNLESDVDVFVQLKTGTTSGQFSDKINSSLEALSNFNVEQCYILLLSIFRNQHKFLPKMLYKHVRTIENFTFIYSKIMQLQANEMEKRYAAKANKIEESKEKDPSSFGSRSYSELLIDLKTLLPSKEQFIISFSDLSYQKASNKKLIVYAFRRIEEFYNCDSFVFGTDIHLDHIFPQHPSSKTITKPANLHKIGNLVALDNIRGNKAGNKLPKEKSDIYSDEKMIKSSLIKDLLKDLEYSQYIVDDNFILNRSEKLANLAFNQVWNLDVK